MAHFKDKEDYFRWVRKRKKRRASRAALRNSIRRRLQALERNRDYLKPKFLVPAASLLVAVSILLSLPLRPAKIEAPLPGGAIPLPPPVVAPLPAASEEKRPPPAGPAPGGSALSREEALSQGRKAAVLIRSDHGSGSGFLTPQAGLVVTCAHILGDSDAAEVRLPSGEAKEARVVKRFPNPLNVALLRMEDPQMGWALLGDSDRCAEGEEVAAIGVLESPRQGLELTLSRGRVLRCSGPNQGISHMEFVGEIHPATVGGPILNARGEIIGVALGERADKGFNGARYGLPVNVLKGLLQEDSLRPRPKG